MGRGETRGGVGRLTSFRTSRLISIRTSRLISIWDFFRGGGSCGRGMRKGRRGRDSVFSSVFVGFRPGR